MVVDVTLQFEFALFDLSNARFILLILCRPQSNLHAVNINHVKQDVGINKGATLMIPRTI